MNTPGRRNDPYRRLAFTLIELLVAITIATLVLLVFYALFRSAQQQRSLFQKQDSDQTPHEALRLLSSDLFQTILPEGTNFCPFEANGSDANQQDLAPVFLHLCAPLPPQPHDSDPRWKTPHRIQYLFKPEPQGSYTLLRATQPLYGPQALQPPSTNTLLTSVHRFTLLFYDGTQWLPLWSSKEKGLLPKAAQIQIIRRQADDPAQSVFTEILIPASLTFSPPGLQTNTPPAQSATP